MTQRSNTQETLLLALELLRRIPQHRKITAMELHEQLNDAGFKRDLRTIQRQLEALSGQFEIERDDRTKPYGYQWAKHSKGFSLPMLINEQETLLLSLAEEYLSNLLPVNLMKSMDTFFQQAKFNLNYNPGGVAEKEWCKKVRVVSTGQPLLAPKIDSDVFEQVSRALYANKWLRIDYENGKGMYKEIEVMPLGLAQQGLRLYLVVRYKNYDNERSLALHRMKKAKASTISFEKPSEFDLKKYDADGRFSFGEGKHIKLSFTISKEAGAHLLETPLSEDQVVNGLENTYEITATVVDSDQLTWWLRGFGDEVSLVEKTSVVS